MTPDFAKESTRSPLHDSLWFPVDNSKTFRTDRVSCVATMVMEWGLGPEVFFEPVPKISAGFSYVFLRAVYMQAFEICSLLSLSVGAIRRVFIKSSIKLKNNFDMKESGT